jgi:MYXO-CTERM domain-containing protein
MLAEIPAQGQVRIDVDAVPSKFATGQLGYRLAAKPSAVLTELTPQDNQAESSANVVAKADLGIVLSPTPVNPQPASAALFRLLAANFGPNPAGGVRVEISLPPEVKDVAVLGEDWACQADLPKLHCQRTLLEVGSAPSLDIKITTPIAPGPLTVAAEISSDAQDIQLANNKAESTVQIPGGIVPPKAEPAPASGCSVSPTGAHSPASGMWLLVPALIAWLRQRRPRRAA